MTTLRCFGIRHHGPGSAWNLCRALAAWQPDVLAIEGAPETETVAAIARRPDLVPPVALLLYAPQSPRRAVYYPFAEFTPEWQALRYGLQQNIPVVWIDLPQAQRFALADTPDNPFTRPSGGNPMATFARAAGAASLDEWWERAIEQRRETEGVFEAVREAAIALRERETATAADLLREAAMRQILRRAQQQYQPQRLAVVCGAWHVPALLNLSPEIAPDFPQDLLPETPDAAEDAARLAGLPETAVAATWVPWSYGKLASGAGYGAGVTAPGWCDRLWRDRHLPPSAVTQRWLVDVARRLREVGFSPSSAQVIDAVRLAETLAALRDRPMPGLTELQEAAQAVMCDGSAAPMAWVRETLLVGDRLGSVPDDLPATPLQADFRQQVRQLRLKLDAQPQTLDLDVRRPLDLGRSQFLHRLELLGIPWGGDRREAGLGTFRELWQLTWQPSLELALVAAATEGSTVAAASAARARRQAQQLASLPELTALLDRLLRADLPEAVATVGDRLRDLGAIDRDVTQVARALPPLARLLRYGSVRPTDALQVRQVVDRLVVRCCVEFPDASRHLNDEAARSLLAALLAAHGAIALLDDREHGDRWRTTLNRLAESPSVAGFVAGGSTRLLLDGGDIAPAVVEQRLGWVLSAATPLERSAAWVEGFLQGSGLLLLHDDRLFRLVDVWVRSLPEDRFVAVLPLLHRTFARFTAAERRQLRQKVRRWGASSPASASSGEDWNEGRSGCALPALQQIFQARH